MKKLFLYNNINFKKMIDGKDILKNQKIDVFKNWVKFLAKLKKEKKILLIFISGESNTGKSTWGIELCKRFGIRNLIHTDILREFVRSNKKKKLKDPIHLSSYKVYRAYDNKFSKKNFKKGFFNQCKQIDKVLYPLVKHSSNYGKVTLVEGINLLPSLIKQNYKSQYFINFHITQTDNENKKGMEKDRYEYNYLNRNLKKYVSFKKQLKFLKTILVEDALESKSKIIYSNEAKKMLFDFINTINFFLEKKNKKINN